MAESDAIVNVLNLLGKNFTALSEKVTESAERQNSAFEKLNDSLESIVDVQSAQLKIAKDSEEAAKKRQTGIDEKKVKQQREAAAKQREASIESIKGLGAVVKSRRDVKEQSNALKPFLKEISAIPRNSAAAMLKFSRSAKKTKATGLRGAATRGLGATAGGLAKILKNIPKMLGPIARVALTIASHFDKLQGAIGFLISGGIAILGTVIFGLKEKMKGLTEKFQPLIQYIKDLPGNLRILFTETIPAKFKEFIDVTLPEKFEEIKTFLTDTVFKPIGDFFTGFPDTLLVFVEDTFSNISNVINNLKTSVTNLFTELVPFLMNKIVSILKNIPIIKKFFKDEEKKKSDILAEEEEVRNRRINQGTGITMKDGLYVGAKNTTPQDMVDNKGVINKSYTPPVLEKQTVDMLGNEVRLLKDAIQEQNTATLNAIDAQKELSDNIKDKDMNTTIINNTAPAPTQSYSNGGKSRN